ncbi:MAG: hypothetical protein J6Y29_05235 [Clostridiales bacterium]|nr:hypothetical protein [Clostridiales bacterium]
MRYIVNNIKLSIDQDISELNDKVARKLRISQSDIRELDVVKESIDARDKGNINFVYSVRVYVDKKIRGRYDRDVRLVSDTKKEDLVVGNREKLMHRPVIIGLGPAGLFCGLILAKNGYRPLIIEMGDNIENRSRKVSRYWEQGVLDVDTNVQFGEGGAGTFSDGKLTTRINDPRCDFVLREFCRFGAPKEISYQAKPHIGSDILKGIIVNLRKEIIRLGGTVKFNTKMTDLILKDNRLDGIKLANGEEIDTNVVVLAIGHSSRETFSTLLKRGLAIDRKPFSIGVRIEHPQYLVNESQYGAFANHPRLKNAIYQLCNKVGDRTAYSFCMCPGGIVVAAASEPNTIVTNGMSNYMRNEVNANSAFVVSVNPSDFGDDTPLSGVDFQRKWERLAYKEGQGGAPIQTLRSFLKDEVDKRIRCVRPSYTGKTMLANLNRCLPKYVTDILKVSAGEFSKKMSCFCLDDAILTGVETRTSSPVRILRDSNFEAWGIRGIYPCGEGAGYAGGIMSASVDGIRIAEKIMQRYTK